MAAFLATAIMIPMDQVLVIGGLHFPMIRVLIVFGAIRIIRESARTKGQLLSGGFNALDKWFLVLVTFTALNCILLWQNAPSAIFAAGNLYSAVGSYFVWRVLVRDEDDVRQAIRTLATIMVPIALMMLVEHFTGHNYYYKFLGGASANEFAASTVRDGKLRAQGPFLHPILAGSFGGFCFPLFVGLWWRGIKTDRKFALLGMAAAIVPPFAASSSTALFGFLGGLIGLSFWMLRSQLRIIRLGLVALLVSLHMVMKAPVWELINRVDLTGGSSSYHRFQLVNQCILHFSSWWLVGTKDYASWGWDMWDLSDSYVGVADTSGLIPLIAFIAILVVAYRYAGLARKFYGDRKDKKMELFLWAFGGSLFANTIAFIGIGYFDQTVVAWYCLLAMVSAITVPVRVPALAGAPALAAAKPEGRVEIRKPAAGPRGPLQPFPGKNVGPIPKYNPVRQKL